MFTSFAANTDHFAAPLPLSADDWARGRKPAAKAAFAKTHTAKPVRQLTTRFAASSRKPANDKRRSGGADSEGIIGSAILEGLFFGAFPLLGVAFHGLNVLDAVDMYDTARHAFRRANRHPITGQQMAANNDMAPAPRRRRSMLALLLG